jgi:penicillin-binding protein 2
MQVYREDQKALSTRISVATWLVVAVFVVLAASFWYVQVVEAEKYRNLAEANALRQLTLSAPRGVIYDRSGRILADNQPSYTLTLRRNELKIAVRQDDTHRDRLVAFVAGLLETTGTEIESRIERGRSVPFSQPLTIAEDLSIPQVATVEAARLSFPSLAIATSPRRNYSHGVLAAHVLGYMGEATPKDLRQDPDLRMGDLVGKRGVELVYDRELRGRDGHRFVVVDSHGRIKEEYPASGRQPEPGKNIHLTIDVELQTIAEDFFFDKNLVGSCVALDPRTGEVLVMLSSPAYDPNVFSRRFSRETWKEIVSNPFKVELNRSIQGLYSPGSVFKIVMGLAGLQSGVIDENSTSHCSGSQTYYGRRFRCWKREGHGTVRLERAMQVSCDIFFYDLGAKLGIDRIEQFSHLLTCGELTQIDLEGERAGLVPSVEWAATKQNRKWYPSETISVAIGQGPLLVTPLQVASLTAAVATGGVVHRPHLLQKVEEIDDDGRVRVRTVPPKELHRIDLADDAFEPIRQALWKVVNEPGGTGGRSRVAGLDVVGKTGTVQVVSQETWIKSEDLPFKFRDHAWYTSFAPRDDAELVVVVFVEHGGHGGADAAPLAKLIYEKAFEKRLSRLASGAAAGPAGATQ